MIFLLLNLSAGKIYAQEETAGALATAEAEEETKNYQIVKGGDKNLKIVQKLSWNEISNIKNYTITVEKLVTGGGYEKVFEKETSENFAEVSLEPGTYRYRVKVLTVLDKEKYSEWKSFKILKALKPKINSVLPETVVFTTEERSAVFDITGENILPESVFKITGGSPLQEITGSLLSSEENIFELVFEFPQEISGDCTLIVTNPGGLSDIYDRLSVKYKKRKTSSQKNLHFMLSAGYVLPAALYDGTLVSYSNAKVFPISAKGKITLMAFGTKAGDFGFGLDSNYSRIKTKTSVYDFSAHMLTGLFDIVYRHYIVPDKVCFDVHAGAGVGMLLDAQFDYSTINFKSPKESSMGLAFGGGFAVQYYPLKHLYIEAGVDFVHTKFNGMNFGALYPSVLVGGMF